jgi:hypothetical protein
MVMVDLRTGCPECKGTKFTEHILKGRKEDVYYDDGYIVKETITYTKDRAYVTCDNSTCNSTWDDYIF